MIPETSTADLEQAVLSLTRYAREFFPPDAQGQTNITLKLDHCLRVFREAEALVAGEGLDREISLAALWAALFHDVGRFPQYARFGTFDDRKSEDHGRLGVRVLKEEGFLHALLPAQKKTVMAAVILHNLRFLPQGLPRHIALPSRLVRDADKLDIFAVMLEHLRPNAPSNHVVTLDLRDDPAAYSKDVINHAMQGRLADYAQMVWINDFRLLLCSWIYDLNFSTSRRAVLERGFVDELLSPLPDTPDIRRVAQKVRMDLRILANT